VVEGFGPDFDLWYRERGGGCVEGERVREQKEGYRYQKINLFPWTAPVTYFPKQSPLLLSTARQYYYHIMNQSRD
jgi:hypothetical protein